MSITAQPVLLQIVLIGLGAAAGALLRWQMQLWLNPVHSWLPLGTLLVNLLGGLLMGLLLAAGDRVPAETRLLLATGFLGALTTFSAFSAEASTLLLQQRLLEAGLLILLHVTGALTATLIGFAVASWLGRLGS